MKAIDLNATYLTLVNEGATLFGDGKPEAALGVFWKAFRLQPSAPVVLFNIGRAMEELNDPRMEDFYAAAASQGNTDAFYQLATYYVRTERKEAAVGSLRAYLNSKPSEDECTQWARQTLFALMPPTGLTLIWKNPKKVKKPAKLSRKDSQKQVKFGIL
jgi:tetratricopeptide (TPR) repeat protein